MKKINFVNGTTIDGASTFNTIQDNVEEVFNGDTSMGSIRVEDIGCKNLLENINGVGSVTMNGITFTTNKDKSITINGTSTAQARYYVKTSDIPLVLDSTKTYYISGANTTNNINIEWGLDTGTRYNYGVITGASSIGNVMVFINKGNTIDNVTIYPQVELGNEMTSYTPYKKFYYNETESMGNIVVDDITCKNLFNIFKFRSAGYSTTIRGVTFTVQNDGGIKVSGTATGGTADFYLIGYWGDTTSKAIQLNGTYSIGSISPSKGSIFLINGSTSIGGSGKPFTRNMMVNSIMLRIYQDVTMDEVIYIQLEKGETTTPYVPYKEFAYNLPQVLWQNSSPTSTFAGQNITLKGNIENYSYYEILFKYNRTDSTMFSTGKIPVGFITFLNLAFFSIFVRKITSMSGNTLTFDNAYYQSTFGSDPSTESNGYIIPYQVIGYDMLTSTSTASTVSTASLEEEN
ncbi:MAG: hypothetical protein IJ371_06510 [Clostridia bacterium]|nr:hypothetical protein [Clostridia bacterium]